MKMFTKHTSFNLHLFLRFKCFEYESVCEQHFNFVYAFPLNACFTHSVKYLEILEIFIIFKMTIDAY